MQATPPAVDQETVRLALLLLLIAGPLAGQGKPPDVNPPAAPVRPPKEDQPPKDQPLPAQRSAREALAESIARQRASVQRQVGAPAAPQSFFTVPWQTLPGSAATSASGVTYVAAADCDPLPRATLDPLIEAAAHKQDLDPKVIRAVIDQESGGRPCAVSPKGAQGLMQLMPPAADQLQLADPFDPEQNLEAGSRLLKQLLVRYDGDLTKALSAYNAGPDRVDRIGGVPRIPETIRYVSAIMGALFP